MIHIVNKLKFCYTIDKIKNLPHLKDMNPFEYNNNALAYKSNGI